jgi:murein DD-endopeptidase MepM/ murein hydrolase activator NlpD
MPNKRLYTFIIAGNSDSRLWRFSIAFPVLLGIGILAFAGLISAGIATFHYGRMLLQVQNYGRILAENDSFRSENHNYRIQTAQLGEKIDFLETTSHKLLNVAGMNAEDAVGGVGGFSKEEFSNPLPATRGTLKSIDTYNKSVGLLEDRFHALDEFLSEKALVEGAWPAFLPLKGYITAGMGRREDPFNAAYTDYHTGIDISAPYGSTIYAPADGVVMYAGMREGYGNIVVLDHKFGIASRYGHLSKIAVEVGERILRSDVLGYVGTTGRTTGPHLHYELWLNNRPVNPQKWIFPSMVGGM